MTFLRRPLAILWILTLLCRAYSAESEPSPDAQDIVRAGKTTLRKFSVSPTAWRIKCTLPDGSVVALDVLHDTNRMRVDFSQVINTEPQRVCRLLIASNVWHVEEKGHYLKTRPYEAVLHMPAAYMFLALSDLRFVVDAQTLRNAVFDSRHGKAALYHIPLPEENRRSLEWMLKEYEDMAAKDPKLLQRPETANVIRNAKHQLAKGTPLRVDIETGLLLETKLNNIFVTLDHFEYLTNASRGAFLPAPGLAWDDQSQPWKVQDIDNCIMVTHDPIAVAGSRQINSDGCLMNLKTGRIRRLPFHGTVSMPSCFLKDRTKVIVSGFDMDGNSGMVQLDLLSGENKAITYSAFKGGISMSGELSPDGKTVAAIRTLSGGKILDMQITLVNLATGKATPLGDKGRIGGPFSWLPDGEGLIVKRFEPQADLHAIEPRILCRLDLDGKLTDLRRGDWPVVLHKSRRILYQDNDPRLWHTCQLDGAKPELFADGMKDRGTPAVSPDEKQIVFAHYRKGILPQLLLYDFGKTEGTPIHHETGFTGAPIWR